VYLETSFVSACVTTRTSLRSVYEREASLFWWHNRDPDQEAFVSDEVLNELSRGGYPTREEALRFVQTIPVLPITQPMVEFAQVLIERKVMPRPVAGDALHLATSVLAAMDYMVTWNVRHLANPNKVLHLNAICVEHGYVLPKIVRPDDLMEMDQ